MQVSIMVFGLVAAPALAVVSAPAAAHAPAQSAAVTEAAVPIQSEAGPAAEAPSFPRAAQPRDKVMWMKRVAGAYPSAALANELEGTVGVQLTVSATGRPSACSVTQSSGEAVLDEAACKAFRRYARFDPALDESGKAIVGRWNGSVAYRLP